jgi:hypothetical protein
MRVDMSWPYAWTWLFLCLSMALFPGLARAEPPCRSSLDKSSVDFGDHAQGDLSNASAQRRVVLHVQCDRAVPLAIAFVAPVGPEGYRFGDGSMHLRVVAARVDGESVLLAREGGADMAESLPLRPGDRLTPMRAGLPAVGANFSLDIVVDVQWRHRKAPDIAELRSVGRFVVY